MSFPLFRSFNIIQVVAAVLNSPSVTPSGRGGRAVESLEENKRQYLQTQFPTQPLVKLS
ncbi:hypothetical protein BT93_K0153 [Corymbia citriodora subsp. variegata]|nr:hypothetical protein BT93_K0153 [Corymbia citriodora subsp. variegata]